MAEIREIPRPHGPEYPMQEVMQEVQLIQPKAQKQSLMEKMLTEQPNYFTKAFKKEKRY